MFVADWSFLDALWALLVIFVWVIWFWLLITIFVDLFRRKDASGWKKTAWIIFVIVMPFIGVFAYLIANSDEMADRNMEHARAQQEKFDTYVKETAAGADPAAQIEKAKGLLDSGAITQEEYDQMKAKALAQM